MDEDVSVSPVKISDKDRHFIYRGMKVNFISGFLGNQQLPNFKKVQQNVRVQSLFTQPHGDGESG